jgi:hypothetical protein
VTVTQQETCVLIKAPGIVKVKVKSSQGLINEAPRHADRLTPLITSKARLNKRIGKASPSQSHFYVLDNSVTPLQLLALTLQF